MAVKVNLIHPLPGMLKAVVNEKYKSSFTIIGEHLRHSKEWKIIHTFSL